MKLNKLTLRNFKGIKDFTLNANGQNLTILGDNGAGKTSIFDAFTYLLTDKDSRGKAEFGIKTLDANNVPIPGLEHEVEAELDFDGRLVMLKKVESEVWTKKRGEAKETCTGNTTSYFIDGVPKSKKEYDTFVGGLIDEKLSKLLTSPSYFNEQLHWQERRKILLEICGDATDAEVIASDKKLAKLTTILNGRSLEDHRKVIGARRTKINEELAKIPVRIDEVVRGLPDVSALDVEAVTAGLDTLKQARTAKEQELSRVQNGTEIAEKLRELRDIDGKLREIANIHRSETSDKVYYKKLDLQKLQFKLTPIPGEILSGRKNIEINEAAVKRCEDELQKLRDQWFVANAETLQDVPADICPSCHQTLPMEQIETARQTAQTRHNQNKAAALEQITGKAAETNRKIAELHELTANINKNIENLTNEQAALEPAIQALQADIDELEKMPGVETRPDYAAAMEQKAAVQEQITQLETDTELIVEELKEEIEALTVSIQSGQAQIDGADKHKKAPARIEELMTEEKTLSAELEKLEGELFLTEEFTRVKVASLEGRINSKFKFARFKMFNQQVNGGLEETCQTTFNGVPYGEGLNTGHRAIVGMDIISTLCDHYGVYLPLFADNAESVSVLPEMKAQVIRLVKPEIRSEEDRKKYSKLVIEGV